MANTKTNTTSKQNNKSTNNSGKKTSKGSTSSKSTGSKSNNSRANSAKNTSSNVKKAKIVAPEESQRDPFFTEQQSNIILIATLAISILMFISNLGICGVVGNAIAGFFFGLFGMTQYILPIFLVVAIFFYVANPGNKVVIVKITAAFIMQIFISTMIELISHGADVVGPINAFMYSFENKLGGGILGGIFSFAFVSALGIIGAYIVDIILIIVCLVVIADFVIFNSFLDFGRTRARKNELKRKNRRIDEELRREEKMRQSQRELDDRREQIRRKKEAEIEFAKTDESSRRVDKKRSGITFNTDISADSTAMLMSDGSDVANKIESDLDISDTARHKLKPNSVANRSNIIINSDTVNDEPIIDNIKDDRQPVSSIKFNIPDDNDTNDARPNSAISDLLFGNNNSATASVNDNATASVNDNDATDVNYNDATDVNYNDTTGVNYNDTTGVNTVSEIAYDNNGVDDASEKETTRVAKPSVSTKEEQVKESEAIGESIEKAKEKPKKPYKFPPVSLLDKATSNAGDSKQYLNEMAEKLQKTLQNFGVDAQVTEVTQGPSVTRYEIQPAVGVKVSKIVNLSDDLKLNMAVTDLRMEAPIPGKSAIGIEVPNKTKKGVSFEELVKSKEFKENKSNIAFCVGKDIAGQVVVGNIEKMPHMLIAGATGSGKSVCINTIIMSILYHASPEDVKLIMVDPKVVELSVYNGIPHLLIPVVTDPKKAAGALHWAVKEMTDRYELLAEAGVRNIAGYNEKVAAGNGVITKNINGQQVLCEAEKLPQIVIILDELADLMMVAAADVEESICRLAQLARAAGIHLVIATQRPTSNVITGLIKANVPSRIAFSVATGLDSRVILDTNGAEDLLGHGDMLYAPAGSSKPTRIQGAFVSDDEINRVIDFVVNNNTDYLATGNDEINQVIAQSAVEGGTVSITNSSDISNDLDPLFAEAGRLVIENDKGSIGYLQRNFRIGFNRAARIMDSLTEKGVVGPEMGTKPREIKMSLSEFEDLLQHI